MKDVLVWWGDGVWKVLSLGWGEQIIRTEQQKYDNFRHNLVDLGLSSGISVRDNEYCNILIHKNKIILSKLSSRTIKLGKIKRLLEFKKSSDRK